jgi:hypothetical protein
MDVCRKFCVLSGRGLCDGLIIHPEESYRLWRVVVCDEETSKNEEPKARYRAVKIQPQWVVTPGKQQQQQQQQCIRMKEWFIELGMIYGCLLPMSCRLRVYDSTV